MLGGVKRQVLLAIVYLGSTIQNTNETILEHTSCELLLLTCCPILSNSNNFNHTPSTFLDSSIELHNILSSPRSSIPLNAGRADTLIRCPLT